MCHKPCSNKSCKTCDKLTIVEGLPTEEADAVEEEDGEAKQQVLVEEEVDHAGDTGIGPAAMHQQQRLQEAELGNAEVTAHHSLHSFLPTDTHTCLDTLSLAWLCLRLTAMVATCDESVVIQLCWYTSELVDMCGPKLPCAGQSCAVHASLPGLSDELQQM